MNRQDTPMVIQICNADFLVDMGPGGGDEGGRIVATGTPEELARNRASITGSYL